MKVWGAVIGVLAAAAAVGAAKATALPFPGHGSPWGAAAENQAIAIVANMTFDEKLSMLHGHLWYGCKGCDHGANVPSPGHQIPPVYLNDGPQGVGDLADKVTQFPSALTVAATFSSDHIRRFGVAMAEEQASKGNTVMLGPMLNLARVPTEGRMYEGCGEDPHLCSLYATHVISGIQSVPSVVATAKHFVDNSQEFHRKGVREVVPARAQWELYYPAFQAAVDAGCPSVMCSYNRVNDTYACENPRIMSDLRDRMGFRGWVNSDWGATTSTGPSMKAGLDQEMPLGVYYSKEAIEAARVEGKLSESDVSNAVEHLLTGMIGSGLFHHPATGNQSAMASTAAHRQLAQELAEKSAVLVKNAAIGSSGKPLLPAAATALRSVVVLGHDGATHGDGSGFVRPTGGTPTVQAGLAQYLAEVAPGCAVTAYGGNDTAKAAQLAAAADLVVLVLGETSSEGQDRATLALPAWQDQVAASVLAAAGDKTAVVVHGTGAVLMPWLPQANAVVVAFMPGQEAGPAIANVLFGAVSPMGRLPLSFPNSDNDTWLSIDPAKQYGANASYYLEGLLVGYRWYDAQGTKPLLSFGTGLGYAALNVDAGSLAIDGPLTDSHQVAVTISASVGARQSPATYTEASMSLLLFLEFPASAGEPPKVLRRVAVQTASFDAVTGQPASTTMQFKFDPLTLEDVAVWDVEIDNWRVVTGQFGVWVGTSADPASAVATGTLTVTN